MRIISGKYKGTRLTAPAKLPVRPTTDRAKESLFNILANHFDFGSLEILDLFAGTGNIAFEFVSRGCKKAVCVDVNHHCIRFIGQVAQKLHMPQLQAIRANVSRYINQETDAYDVIFVDPPYYSVKLQDIADKIFERNLLKDGGWLVIEHPALVTLDQLPGFIEKRQYGQSTFSIFMNNKS